MHVHVHVCTFRYGDQGSFYTDGANRSSIAESDDAMLFTSFFVAYGICVIAATLAFAIEEIMAIKDEAMEEMQDVALNALLNMEAVEDPEDESEEGDPLLDAELAQEQKKQSAMRMSTVVDGDEAVLGQFRGFEGKIKEIVDGKTRQTKDKIFYTQVAATTFVLLLVYGLGTLVMMMEESEISSFVHALYWLVVTGTTVGYGDLYPTTDAGKWFCIFYLLLVTAVTAQLVSSFADWFTKEADKDKDVKKNMDFTKELAYALDMNDDQIITKWEWLAGMLVRLRYAEPGAVAKIVAHFDKVQGTNKEGGAVPVADLRNTADSMAKRQQAERQESKRQKSMAVPELAVNNRVESAMAHLRKVGANTPPVSILCYSP